MWPTTRWVVGAVLCAIDVIAELAVVGVVITLSHCNTPDMSGTSLIRHQEVDDRSLVS